MGFAIAGFEFCVVIFHFEISILNFLSVDNKKSRLQKILAT